MTIGEILNLFDATTGLSVFSAGTLLSLVLWRWIVSRDRHVDEDRAQRANRTSSEIGAVSAKVDVLSSQVQACATREDLRRTDDKLAKLETEVRVNEARVLERLDGVDKRLVGQSVVLDRIEEHLLRGVRQ